VALSGLQIFKLLPKTNCKDCGYPTCMAFAMQLAAGKVRVEACPHLPQEAGAQLSDAVSAPVSRVTVGSGASALAIGEETVLYRHEKRFEHAPGLAVLAGGSLSDVEFAERLEAFSALTFERVGEPLRPNMLAISASDGAVLEARVARAASLDAAVKAALIVMHDDPAVLRRACAPVADGRPLLYAADPTNWRDMGALARDLGAPLAVKAAGIEELIGLVEKLSGAGVEQLVLDSSPVDVRAAVRDQVFARRAAVKSRLRSLGYPTIAFACRLASDPALAAVVAGVLLCRYAGIIVLDTVDPALWLPLCVLSQNIYTDPQRPMQVEEGVYPIGEPGPDSPVLVTTNFSLTYFTVSGEVEASRVPSWLLVMNAEGQSVLTAWAAGKFVPEAIAAFIRRSGIEEKVGHRRLVIPGYVAQISGELAEELSGWDIEVGVREAVDIPRYLRSLVGSG